MSCPKGGKSCLVDEAWARVEDGERRKLDGGFDANWDFIEFRRPTASGQTLYWYEMIIP